MELGDKIMDLVGKYMLVAVSNWDHRDMETAEDIEDDFQDFLDDYREVIAEDIAEILSETDKVG